MKINTPASFRYALPFSFDHYSMTATLSPPESATSAPVLREGREAAWRHLRDSPLVSLEVRLAGDGARRTLCFANGRYRGYRVGSSALHSEDCPELDRFLDECRSRLQLDDHGRVRLSGVAREIVAGLVEAS